MKRSELALTAIKPPLDYFNLILAAIVAYILRYQPFTQKIRPVVFDLPFSDYISIALPIAIGWIVIFVISGLYTVGGFKSLREELARVFVACSAGLALVLAVMVFTRFLFDSRFIILTSWILAFIFVSFGRIILQIIKKQSYKLGIGVHRLALIGDSKIAQLLNDEFTSRPTLGYRVVYRAEEFSDTVQSELFELKKKDGIDELIQIRPNMCGQRTIDLINFAEENHFDFKYTADLLGAHLINLEVSTYAGLPIIEVKRTPLDGWGRIHKRIFDIIVSLILIILFSPVMLITALAVKLTSPGPILFKYKRIGQNGKAFTYFKFRSMIDKAHELRFDENFVSQHDNLRAGSPMMKFANDPRITPVGRFIRRFSIDELTELFLVFGGKMSLVGPRPHEVEEVEKYKHHHKKVLTIKPGMSGLAQISGRSDLNFEDEVKLDIYYIENWSLGLDLQILFKTPMAVLRRRNAE